MATTTQRTDRGVSLSRGPALLIGTVLLIGGLYFLYAERTFPSLHQFPNGTAHVHGKAFFHIFGVNGWSGELTAAAGGLLLFGSAEHRLAKATSFITAIALGGVAIWALVNHHSALGIFAANIWTIVGWGGAALILLLNVLAPRAGGSRTTTLVPDPAYGTVTATRSYTPADSEFEDDQYTADHTDPGTVEQPTVVNTSEAPTTIDSRA